MLLAVCVCADFYEILPKDPKTGSLKLLSATSKVPRYGHFSMVRGLRTLFVRIGKRKQLGIGKAQGQAK